MNLVKLLGLLIILNQTNKSFAIDKEFLIQFKLLLMFILYKKSELFEAF